MAEESLIAEIRLGYQRFQQDLQAAQQAADRQSREIANSLGQIDKSIRNLPASFSSLNASMRQTGQQMSTASQEAGRFSGVMQSLKGTLGAIGLAVTAQQFTEFASAAAKGGEAVLSLEAQLKVMTGSTQGANEAMAFAASEARRLAQDTLTAQKAFTQIATAAKNTAVEGKGAEIIFSGLSNAITATGRSGDEFQRIMNQVNQGLFKGKVELEDMRILAENGIPAQRLLAEAMGMTGEAFAKAMSEGKISAEAFILLGNELTKQFQATAEEAANRLPGAFRKGLTEIRNEFNDLFAAIFQSKELLTAAGPLISGADLFPSRAELTTLIDDQVGQFTRLLAIIGSIFEGVKKVVTDAYTSMATAASDFLDKHTERFKSFVDNLPFAELREQWGLTFKETAKAADEMISDVEDRVENTRPKDKSFFDLLFDTDNAIESLEEMDKRVKKFFGLKDLDLLDPKKTGPAAEKSGDAVVKGLEKNLEGTKTILEDTKKRLTEALNAPSIAEIAKRNKEKLAEDEKYARQKIEQYRKGYEEDEKLAEERAKADIEMAKAVYAIKLKLEEDYQIAKQKAQIQEDIYGDSVQPGSAEPGLPYRQEDIQAAKDSAKRQEEIFSNMRENIQDELGTIFTDMFTGQLDSIEDFADNIVKIFARTAAEIVVAMAVQPILEDLFSTLQREIKNFSFQLPSGRTVTGGQIASVAGVAGASAGIGAGVSDIAGGGPGGAALGGAVGGALTGAYIGGLVTSWSGPFMALGAAIGAVVGALAGLTAGLLSAEEAVAIAPLTSPTVPTDNVRDNVTRRGPFGFISLVEESSSTSPSDTSTVATIIAETDSGIARLMTQRQRDIVTQALQGQHYALDAREMDDSIAQALQTRLYIMLASLTDPGTAANIVGDPYTGTADNIELMQRRAAEALGILKMIEEFKIADMGDVAMQIHRIQEEFGLLISRAQELGLDAQATDLGARRDQEIQQITTDFNADIRDQVLGFTDPALQAAEELEKIQEKIWQDAVAAGADLNAVQELFVLQWEDHARRFGTAGAGSAAAIEAFTRTIEEFGRASLSGTTQQLISLRESFNPLITEANRLGVGVDVLTQSYHEQHNAIVAAAQNNFNATHLALTNPFAAAMLQISMQVEEFQKLVDEGILTQESVDAFRRAAEEQAKYNEALRIASGATASAAETFNQMIEDFVIDDTGLSEAEQRIQEINEQADRLIAALTFIGGETAAADIARVNEARQREINQINAEETAEAAADLDTLAESIRNFSQATMSGTSQQLESLRANFEELNAEAVRLGMSTDALTQSYHEQHNAIIMAAQNNFNAAYLGIVDPFAAALLQISIDVANFQALVAEGILSPETVAAFEQAAISQANYNHALQLASGSATSASDSFFQMVDGFIVAGSGLTQVEIQVNGVISQFANLEAALIHLASTGQITADQLAGYMSQITASRDAQIDAINRAEQERRQAEAERERAQRNAEAERRRAEAQRAREQRAAEAERRRAEAQRAREQRAAEAERKRAEAQRAKEQRQAEAQRRREERAALVTSIGQFGRASLSAASQELAGLTDRFKDMRAEARRLNVNTRSLTRSYEAQAKEIKQQAKQTLKDAINAFIAPFATIHTALFQQAQEFRRMQAEGLLKRSDVDKWQKLAVRDARFSEARALAGGTETAESQYRDIVKAFVAAGRPMSDLGQQMSDLHRDAFRLMQGLSMLGESVQPVIVSLRQQQLEIIEQAYNKVHDVIEAFGNPFQVAMRDAENQIEDLRRLVADGLVPSFYVEYAVRLIKADTLIQEALRRISGAPTSSIGQLAESFDEFIRAGDPLSEVGQELYDLTENFMALTDAAHILGFSTAELEASYLAQSQVIRERAIEDIESQLSSQIDAIEQIKKYLDSLKVSEEQPLNIRLDEARSQFQQSLTGEDISEMVSAAETLRDAARQQYGSTAGFFAVENEIKGALSGIQAREQAIMEAERQRLTEQMDREIRGLQIGQSSLDQLQRVAFFGSEMARGIDEMIALERQAAQREEKTILLLERVVAESRRR
jgi:tape measure domain-containing protein